MAEGVHDLALLESKTSGVLLTLLEKQEAEINSFEGSLSIVIILNVHDINFYNTVSHVWYGTCMPGMTNLADDNN